MFLGFLMFVTIGLIGFWLLGFLVSFLPYWIGGTVLENMGLLKMKEEQSDEK